MLLNRKRFLAASALLLITLAARAASDAPQIDSGQWSTSKTMSIGTTQVMAGTYKFEAPENGLSLFVERDGLEVSDIPCYWVKLPQKAEKFKVFTDKDQVVRIEFADRPYALIVL
jgi:hypothetical protein